MWLLFLWAIGMVLSMCVTIPFFIKKDFGIDYLGIVLVLAIIPIINVLYPIYIIVKYIRPDYKKFL
jgi:hypothetical protein